VTKYSIVVAGCGNMSKEWIAYAAGRPDAAVAALVDVRPEAAEAMKTRFGLDCPVYDDLREAIRSTGANLVFDVTIPEAHPFVLRTAFEEGCDVFGEKPMAASPEEARTMVAEAKASGRTYSVMQNRRYLKGAMAYRDLIRSGAVGDVAYVNVDFFVGLHNGGFRHTMDHPLLMDYSVHAFDLSRFFTGKEPVSVYCQEFNPPGSWYAGDAAAVCIFEYGDGAAFCFRGYYAAGGAQTSWEGAWRIVGTNGTAVWDGTNAPYAEVPREPGGAAYQKPSERIVPECAYRGRERHQGALDEMFEALEAGRPSATDCEDHFKSLLMAFGAVRSSVTGAKVHLASL